jgi:hypothetical protein
MFLKKFCLSVDPSKFQKKDPYFKGAFYLKGCELIPYGKRRFFDFALCA